MDILHLAAPCRNVPVTFTLELTEDEPMHANEFLILLAWLLLPPLGIGFALLAILPGVSHVQLWLRGLVLVLLSVAVAVLFLVGGPASWSRYLGVQDIEVFGIRTMWAPFAFVAVAIAVLPVVAWSRRGVRREP